MADFPPPDIESVPSGSEKQPLTALIGQIVDDTRSFARDEIAFLQAQAGERAHYAMPGLVVAGAALAFGMSAIVALLIGLTIWLATLINGGLAALVICGVAMLVAALAWRWGLNRLRKSLKSRDER